MDEFSEGLVRGMAQWAEWLGQKNTRRVPPAPKVETQQSLSQEDKFDIRSQDEFLNQVRPEIKKYNSDVFAAIWA